MPDTPQPPSASSDDVRAPPCPRRELELLLTLAAIQFMHIVDFMIMMPLGPQFMRLFGVDPQQFALLVSAYTFAAAASGFLAAFWIDRFDRKRALLGLYSGFVLATALCGVADSYGGLFAARVLAGSFGGLIGALVMATVADVVPYARRATATAIVGASFSLSTVAGVPLGIWLAAHYSWRAPFLTLAAASVPVGIVAMRLLPPLRDHLADARRHHPIEQLRLVFGERNHRRAFGFMVALMFAGFSVIPFVAPYNVANVGISEQDLAVIYFAGGLTTLVTAQIIGRLADRYGKPRVFTIVASISIAPILVTTHLPPVPLVAAVAASVLFFVFVSGRFGPAMAIISGSVEPRLRGAFMSFNASIQQLGAGLAASLAGLVIGRTPDGKLTHYGTVGWIAVGFTLVCMWLVHRIRIVGDGPASR